MSSYLDVAILIGDFDVDGTDAFKSAKESADPVVGDATFRRLLQFGIVGGFVLFRRWWKIATTRQLGGDLEFTDFTGAPHTAPPVWQVRSLVASGSIDHLQSIHLNHSGTAPPPSRPAKNQRRLCLHRHPSSTHSSSISICISRLLPAFRRRLIRLGVRPAIHPKRIKSRLHLLCTR